MLIFIILILLRCCYLSHSQPNFVSCDSSNDFNDCQSLLLTEEILPGSVVDTYTFNDTASKLTFTLKVQGTNLLNYSYLSINAKDTSVDLRVSSRIDREDFAINGRNIFFTLTVSGSQTKSFNFYIYVVDIDDCYPVFMNVSYICNLTEFNINGSCPGLISYDPDQDNTVYYEIVSSTTGNVTDFYISQTGNAPYASGYLTYFTLGLNIELNYDIFRIIGVVIQTKDAANHTKLNNIQINVINVPRRPPIFLNLPYIVSMQESLPQNTYVIKVSAVDGDTGINSPIAYSFMDGPYNQYFSINSSTGVITIQNIIVRESADISGVFGIFNLVVLASKNEQISGYISQANISISITDVNNSPAIFSQSVYNGSIAENSSLGSTVFVSSIINVTDQDLGINAQFSIAVLQNGNVSTIFSVFPTIAQNMVFLTLTVLNGQSLVYKPNQSVNVTIQTTQMGPVANISQYSYATVLVVVTGVNKYSPVFNNSSYSFFIYENSPMFTNVGSIQATDQDLGLYGSLTYSLIDASNKFTINSTTGSIYVNVNANLNLSLLNAKVTPLYALVGLVTDGGGLKAFTSISINLMDTNDNPPIFNQKLYISKNIERTFDFIPPLLQVQATDADLIPANRMITYILYNITNDNPSLINNFMINNLTGIITIIIPINRDTLNQTNANILTVFIKAYDPTKPTFFDFCSIQIYIQDVNNEAPILSGTVYNATIPQNISSNSMILTVLATDLDQANTINTLITYRLVGTDATNFVIVPFTNITNGAYIARNPNALLNVRTYNFTVEADDHGIPPLNGTATVLITCTVINNHNPTFNQTTYEYTIYENITVGTVFGQVLATDSDFNANLSYSILGNLSKAWNSSQVEVQQIFNMSAFFRINATTGALMTTSQINYGQFNGVNLQIIVVDLAAQTQNQTATATIMVTILDLNNNPPVFKANIFNLSLLENYSIKNSVTTGATGLLVTATDKDTVGTLVYNSSESSNTFIVDPSLGQIILIKGLDREKVPFYNFSVSCTDGVFTVFATVSVTVLDVNDNEPVFNGLIPIITILQNTSVGTLLQRFNATDLDIGNYATLVFHFTGGQTDQFALSSDGNLTLAKSLLQNNNSSYILIVEVYDNPNGTYSLRCDQQLTVNVILNNNPPVFDVSSYGYSIPENLIIGFNLDKITATDMDSGVNGLLSYSLLLPNVNPNPVALSLFTLNITSNRAQILLTSSLKYKAGTYVLILRATDNGTPPLGANCTLYINVTAINYYAPNFTNPVAPSANEPNPAFSINENIVGIVANISAFDPDEGVNGYVRYSLPPQFENNVNFSINPINGTITNLAAFTKETKALYKCTVLANDLGSPSLTSFINIDVVILNDNVNFPVFVGINKNMSLSVNDGPQIMSPIPNSFLTGFKIGNVARAVNSNVADKSTLCYFLMNNITILYLNQKTGDLYGLAFFNYNLNSLYQSGIKAVSYMQCNNGSIYLNTNYNQSDPSEAMLFLQVLDTNNNPPYFSRLLIIDAIPRFAIPGTQITDFSKYSGDGDTISQGHLTYSIQGNISISSPLSTQLREEQFTQIFSLNTSSGILYIANAVSFVSTMQGYFRMTIAVSDGKFTNTTSYMAYLVGGSQRLIVVINDYLPNVANKTGAIASYLSQQMSAVILVDGLEICTDIYMNTIVGCTFVYIHGLNSTTNMVIDGNSLLNIFQNQAPSMAALTSSYQVSYAMVAVRNISTLLNDSSLQQVITYRMILIIISGIFLFVLIVIGALVFVCRINYQRKLRAYTTSSSDENTVIKSMALPGTNIYENSKNPFANVGIYEGDSNNHIPKKYGIPTFGSGIVLEKNVMCIGDLGDDSKVIDSTETVF